MAQKLIIIKSLGEKKVYNIGIDTPEHILLYKGLLTKNSFNMPHSYAYSLLGYVQAYLKCYYPIEFWCATLNTIDRGQEKHGESTLGKYISFITRSTIGFERPDINKSEKEFYGENNKIYFAMSYIKSVASGCDSVLKNKPYIDWDDFLEKAKNNKFNKRIVKSLIFSGALDFSDEIDCRPYKWIKYILTRKNKKDREKEITETKKKYFKHFGKDNEEVLVYELVRMEYDLLKYSFTGIEETLKNKVEFKKYKNLPTISQRDTTKKFASIIGYIDKIQTKKSKKSGSQYTLLTVTDFQQSLAVYIFGKQREDVQGNLEIKTGRLVKITIKNEGGFIKLPWQSELGNEMPIEIIK
jgi:DNA polymerase III alpha subunit